MKAPISPHNDTPFSGEPFGTIPWKDRDSTSEQHTFSHLQQIQFIEEKAQEALLVLKLNAAVLEQLKNHYIYATGHLGFPDRLKTDCEADLSRFERCISSVEKDLRMF